MSKEIWLAPELFALNPEPIKNRREALTLSVNNLFEAKNFTNTVAVIREIINPDMVESSLEGYSKAVVWLLEDDPEGKALNPAPRFVRNNSRTLNFWSVFNPKDEFSKKNDVPVMFPIATKSFEEDIRGSVYKAMYRDFFVKDPNIKSKFAILYEGKPELESENQGNGTRQRYKVTKYMLGQRDNSNMVDQAIDILTYRTLFDYYLFLRKRSVYVSEALSEIGYAS